MEKSILTNEQQSTVAAIASHPRQSSLVPGAVTMVFSGQNLVITLHGALSAAERALARTVGGALQVQEFRWPLFSNAAESFRQEINRIAGAHVRNVAAKPETSTGTVVQVFTAETMVRVFRLAQGNPVVISNQYEWMN